MPFYEWSVSVERPHGGRQTLLVKVSAPENATRAQLNDAAVKRATEQGYTGVEPFITGGAEFMSAVEIKPERAPIRHHMLYEHLIRFECNAANSASARADIRDVRQTMYLAFEEHDRRARRDVYEGTRETRARLEQSRAGLEQAAAAALRVARVHKVPGVPLEADNG